MRLTRLFGGKSPEFFDLFEEAAGNVVRAATLLEELLSAWPDRPELARDILLCEQEGDRIAHDIFRRLNQGSSGPIERQDVMALTSALDDVVDFTEEVADFLGLYKIEAPMEQAQLMAGVLAESARNVETAIGELRAFRDISQQTVEINRLENDGDRLMRQGLAALFHNGIDPMVVIRWKDIYERLEGAIDATEHVANTLEGIMLKRS